MTRSAEDRPPPSARQAAGDVALAVILAAVAVWIQVGRLDAVPANHRPDAFSVLVTVAASAPLALRRLRPFAVLLACLPWPLLLIAGHYSVGATPLGPVIAFYTCVAWGTRREARAAVPVLLVGVGLVALLRPIDLSVEGALVEVALYLGGWLIGTGVRERRELLAARESEARQDVELARQQAELAHERASRAAAEERLRITRDLHDLLGHALGVVVVQAAAAEHLLDADPAAARQALREIASTGRSSLADIRHVLGRVREDDASGHGEPSPSLDDIPALVARIEAAGLPIRLSLDPELARLAPGVGLAAYRVVQEALTNCLKHASASLACVTVTRDGDDVRIEVQDDGTAPASSDVGNGLTGMRERVSVYGGELRAGPADHGGYLVTARIPLPVTPVVDAP